MPVRWIWEGVGALLITASALSALLRPVSENDLFLHVLMGRDILANGRLTGDPVWTYGPANSDWTMYVHWPSQVLMAGGYDIVGVGFFAALHIVLIAAFFLLLALVLRRLVPSAESVSEARIAAAALAVAALSVIPFMGPRANAFGAVFGVLLGLWVVRVLRSGSLGPRWWIVPLATWIWVLLHGSALLVAPTLVLAGAIWWVVHPGRFSRSRLLTMARLACVVALSAVAPLLTPLGLDAWVSASRLRDHASGWIVEWSALSLRSPETYGLLAIFGIAVLVSICQCRRGDGRAAIGNLLFTIAVTGLIAMAQRNYLILLPVLVVVTSAAALTLEIPGRPRTWETVKAHVSRRQLFAGTVMASLLLAFAAGAIARLDTSAFPVRVLQGLQQDHPDGGRRVFSPMYVGSQIPFFAPGNRAAFDARVDRYGAQDLQESAFAIYVGRPDWQNWLSTRYPGTTDLLLPSLSPLAAEARSSGWAVTHEADGWVLLTSPASKTVG